jgi:predicted DNA-binding protein
MELQTIQKKIYEIRGKQVMLDFDLAALYGVETKVLKQGVKRNIRRFPIDFMFELTQEEFNSLRSQIVTSNKRGGTRYMPFAFTEQGVAMLSSILNSETAIEVNISIIRAFVSIRQYLSVTNNTIKEIEELKQRMKALEEGTEDTIAAINDLSEDTRKELDDIYLALSQLADKQKQITRKSERKPIGFAQYKKEDKS